MNNLFELLPQKLTDEVFETLLQTPQLRIERIVSLGHTSPTEGWYDQAENEWVIVLKGGGSVRFKDNREVRLSYGDYLYIPAHTLHQVTWTDPEEPTIWLAVFFNAPDEPS